MMEVETIVVGGGPAGAATAARLAAAGREVMLIERQAEPHHKVCGEFLSSDTQHHLELLGVDAGMLGAVPVERLVVQAGGRHLESRLPFRALSLSRFRLDAALLARAEQLGADILRGQTAQSIRTDGAGWIVRCGHGIELRSRLLVVATGKWPLRGIAETRDRSLVGLKMHLEPSPALKRTLHRAVELHLLAGGYAGLQLVENGVLNLCLVLPHKTVAAMQRGWSGLREELGRYPLLAGLLEQADPLWDRPLAIACPAAGHLSRLNSLPAFNVGDRFAHIPPLTGDGLAIALSTAELAAAAIGLGQTPTDYAASARGKVAARVIFAGWLSRGLTSQRARPILIHAAGMLPGLMRQAAKLTRVGYTG